jgi:hypothetical protein
MLPIQITKDIYSAIIHDLFSLSSLSFQKLNDAEFEALFGSPLCLAVVHRSSSQ